MNWRTCQKGRTDSEFWTDFQNSSCSQQHLYYTQEKGQAWSMTHTFKGNYECQFCNSRHLSSIQRHGNRLPAFKRSAWWSKQETHKLVLASGQSNIWQRICCQGRRLLAFDSTYFSVWGKGPALYSQWAKSLLCTTSSQRKTNILLEIPPDNKGNKTAVTWVAIVTTILTSLEFQWC